MISNEPMSFLLDRLTLDLNELASPQSLPHGFLDATLCKFCDEGSDLCEDVFTCVTSPTGRAGESVLRISISGASKRYAACAAKDVLGVDSH